MKWMIMKIKGGLIMEKMKYAYEGVVYEVNRELVEKWLEREGIRKNTLKYHNAMICIVANAKGRLEMQDIEPGKEDMEKAMEELIQEEVMLTGGQA